MPLNVIQTTFCQLSERMITCIVCIFIEKIIFDIKKIVRYRSFYKLMVERSKVTILRYFGAFFRWFAYKSYQIRHCNLMVRPGKTLTQILICLVGPPCYSCVILYQLVHFKPNAIRLKYMVANRITKLDFLLSKMIDLFWNLG